MADTICRTIVISVVWVSIAMFLTFGLPSLQTGGINQRDFLPFCAAVIVACVGGAVAISAVIWIAHRPREEKVVRSHGFEVLASLPATEQK